MLRGARAVARIDCRRNETLAGMLIAWLPPYNGFAELVLVILAAMALDALVGDPPWLYRVVPHPVAAIGRLIGALDARWNDAALGDEIRRRRGVKLAVAVAAGALALAWIVGYALGQLTWGWLLEALLASALLSFRGLYDHVRRVAVALDDGLGPAQTAVGHIVGRDPASLDEHGVARAAIESAAENFADGTVAPVVWYLLLGLPGLVAYKAINTMDSMIGYRSPRHEAFGAAAAKLDDAVNFGTSRLAGLVFVIAAAAVPGADAAGAWRAMRRDAPKHRSPNAGWPEAAVAGALGLAIAGPRRYGQRTVDDHWMGDGRRQAGAADVRRALALYLAAGALLALAVAFGAVL
jgi:adenosylcobinamide-phosphate synthase